MRLSGRPPADRTAKDTPRKARSCHKVDGFDANIHHVPIVSPIAEPGQHWTAFTVHLFLELPFLSSPFFLARDGPPMASNMLLVPFDVSSGIPFLLVLPPPATGVCRSRGSDLEDLLPFLRVDVSELCDRESTS